MSIAPFVQHNTERCYRDGKIIWAGKDVEFPIYPVPVIVHKVAAHCGAFLLGVQSLYTIRLFSYASRAKLEVSPVPIKIILPPKGMSLHIDKLLTLHHPMALTLHQI